MRDGLKIYACSGFGVGDTNQQYTYWRDNTETIENTRAVNGLLAHINLLFAKLRYEQMTDSEVLTALNLIDLYVVCLNAAETYHGEELRQAGRVIASMVDDGAFSYTSLDNGERDNNLDSLLAQFGDRYGQDIDFVNNSFYEWFLENVSSQDYNPLSGEQKQRARAAIKGVGAINNDPVDYLHGGGGYFLYLYMLKQTAQKCGKVVQTKRQKQSDVLEYVHHGYDQLYPSPEYVNEIIYTGITDSYKKTPEAFIKDLTGTKGKHGIGILPETVAAISAIASLIGVILTFLKMILDFVVSIVAIQYAEPKGSAAGAPSDEDFSDLEADLENKEKKSRYLKYGIIGILLYMILK